jgi:hypothetical protein
MVAMEAMTKVKVNNSGAVDTSNKVTSSKTKIIPTIHLITKDKLRGRNRSFLITTSNKY